MVDQDAFNLVVALAAVAILVSGLRRGSFRIQCLQARREAQPFAYSACALVLTLIAAEAVRRAWFVGCAEC
jgi:hypothetical protein